MFQIIGCFDVVGNEIFGQGRRGRRFHPSAGKAVEPLNNKTANGSQYFHIQFNANPYLSENKAKWKQKVKREWNFEFSAFRIFAQRDSVNNRDQNIAV